MRSVKRSIRPCCSSSGTKRIGPTTWSWRTQRASASTDDVAAGQRYLGLEPGFKFVVFQRIGQFAVGQHQRRVLVVFLVGAVEVLEHLGQLADGERLLHRA